MSTYEEKKAANAAARAQSIDPTKIAIRFDPRSARMSGRARHGNTPFDVPFISLVEGNLWQGGCENGLVLPAEIVHLVSLYPWEHYTVNHELRSVLSVAMYDSLDQGLSQLDAIASWVNACADDGPTLVHCQAGLNRSGIVAARALMMRGRSADGAIDLLRTQRSPAVLCNVAFADFLRSIDEPATLA